MQIPTSNHGERSNWALVRDLKPLSKTIALHAIRALRSGSAVAELADAMQSGHDSVVGGSAERLVTAEQWTRWWRFAVYLHVENVSGKAYVVRTADPARRPTHASVVFWRRHTEHMATAGNNRSGEFCKALRNRLHRLRVSFLWESPPTPLSIAAGNSGMACPERLVYDELKSIGQAWNQKRPERACRSLPAKATMDDKQWQQVLACHSMQWKLLDKASLNLSFAICASGKGVIGRRARVKELADCGFDWFPHLAPPAQELLDRITAAVNKHGFLKAFRTFPHLRRYRLTLLVPTRGGADYVTWLQLSVVREFIRRCTQAGITDQFSYLWVPQGSISCRSSPSERIPNARGGLERCKA